MTCMLLSEMHCELYDWCRGVFREKIETVLCSTVLRAYDNSYTVVPMSNLTIRDANERTTSSGGSLGSCIDEERCQLR